MRVPLFSHCVSVCIALVYPNSICYNCTVYASGFRSDFIISIFTWWRFPVLLAIVLTGVPGDLRIMFRCGAVGYCSIRLGPIRRTCQNCFEFPENHMRDRVLAKCAPSMKQCSALLIQRDDVDDDDDGCCCWNGGGALCGQCSQSSQFSRVEWSHFEYNIEGANICYMHCYVCTTIMYTVVRETRALW